MRVGLVYLPERTAASAYETLAGGLVVERRPRAVVGPAALPHLSLLHVETERDPGELWTEARAAVPHVVDFGGLALGLLRYDTPYNAPPAPPATMAWLIVPCSRALRAAEQAALALPFVARAAVTTANEDRFQPHVTLAIWDGEPAPASHALPEEIFATTQARLALGVIGPNGTYERSLFEA